MRKYIGVLIGLFLIVFTVSIALAADLTADTITKAGKKTTNGKIAVKGDKYRLETAYNPIFYIGRGDKGVFWEINGAEKTYAQGKLTPATKPKIDEKLPGEVSRKQLGTETMDGRTVKKSEVTTKEGNKNETYLQWWATDIGFPLKLAKSDGTWSVEYKNIKTGAADSMFELPAGVSEDKSYVPDVLH